MSKYHITEEGPRPCRASVQACPLGGEHYSSLEKAEAAYADFFQPLTGASRNKAPSNSLQSSVVSQVVPMSGGHYYGSHIEAWTVAPHLEAFRALVGEERAALMELNKEARDRGRVYHMTVVTPPEMKTLSRERGAFPAQITIEYLGVGRASDRNSEAWFIVCRSEAIEQWRRENGLPPKDLHVTLGFDPKDVHSTAKDKSTLVVT